MLTNRIMDDTPVMSAYPDEQEKLDTELENEVKMWKKVKQLLDTEGYEIRVRLVDGLPDLYLVRQ